MKTCTIYFIQIGVDGPIKIGRTLGSPMGRLNSLQVGIPYDLQIIATIPDAESRVELEIHRRFAHLNIRGEWFGSADELIKFIRECAEPWVAQPVKGVYLRRKPGRLGRDLPPGVTAKRYCVRDVDRIRAYFRTCDEWEC